MSTTQHDQAGGPGDQRADHGDGDQAAAWWPAAAFPQAISAGRLWKASEAGRIRYRLNRIGTRRLYSVADARLEWPHLLTS